MCIHTLETVLLSARELTWTKCVCLIRKSVGNLRGRSGVRCDSPEKAKGKQNKALLNASFQHGIGEVSQQIPEVGRHCRVFVLL